MRILLITALLMVMPFAAGADDKRGTIRGVVRFAGTVPPDKKIGASDGSTIIHNDYVVDPKTKGLRWVGIVLEDAPAQPKLKDPEPEAVIDQVDMIFTPRMVAVQHGRRVRFDNSDICNHNVRAFSTTSGNELNAFVTAAQPVKKIFTAEKAPIKIGCSLHAWMTAWVFVVPHPWFAVSDEKGTFTIKNVPPGKYTLWLRHPDTGMHERCKIEVKSGETLEVEFEWKDKK
jgi:plastocyanin